LLPSLRALLANCGGKNLRGARFAGNLHGKRVDDAQFLAICHSLILANGVRKTTSPNRNAATLARLVAKGRLKLGRDLDVLDAGASVGLDAGATLALLEKHTTVRSYTLGDLCVAVLYDPARGAVFDEDGRLLQVRERLGFTSMHFSWSEPAGEAAAQKVLNLTKRLRPWLLAKRHLFKTSDALVRIPLVHPSVKLDGASPFRMKRVDAFGPIDERYDLIVCMHLLVERYWSKETIEKGERNLANALRPGGTLVAGAAEAGRVWRRRSDAEGDFDKSTYVI